MFSCEQSITFFSFLSCNTKLCCHLPLTCNLFGSFLVIYDQLWFVLIDSIVVFRNGLETLRFQNYPTFLFSLELRRLVALTVEVETSPRCFGGNPLTDEKSPIL